MSYKSSKVLVTGSGGFIGKPLASKLRESKYDLYEIRDRNDCDLSKVEDAKRQIQQIDPDIIIHLAASPDTAQDITSGHAGFHNTVSCALNVLFAINPTRTCLFIHAGSYKQYGDISIPFSENDNPHPVTMYGLAKQAAENLSRCRENKLARVVYLRIGSVFGPGQPPSAFINRAIQASLNQDIEQMHLADVIWDPIYISDVVDAICACITTPEAWGRTINISGGKPYTPMEVFKLIATMTSGGLDRIKCDIVSNGYYSSLGDIRLAGRLLGWTPQVTLSKGLQLTIESRSI